MSCPRDGIGSDAMHHESTCMDRRLPTTDITRMSENGHHGSTPPKRLLMIAHAFPPTGGSGVQRTAKFARYLPQSGWSPTVWCAPLAEGLPRDEALLNELPNTFDRRIFSKVASPSPVARKGMHWRLQKMNDTLRRWSIPDDCITWAKRSLPDVLRLIRDEPIDAIYSTHSPASNHWLAWRVKKATGLPWVADFRDLWTDNYDFTPPTPWHRHRLRHMEQQFLTAADTVVGVTVEQSAILARHLPEQSDKFVTIYNGVDSADFADLDRTSARNARGICQDRCIVSFVGSFVQTAEAPAIIAGLRRVQRTLLGDRHVELRIVGWVPSDMDRLLSDSGIRVSRTGYVSHVDAIREMVAADCLISGNTTTGRNGDSIVPAKIFEYLMTGHPVVHVGAADSAVARVFADVGRGLVVPPTEHEIGGALADVFKNASANSGTSHLNDERLIPYTRRQQAGQLAGILENLTDGMISKPVASVTDREPSTID